MMKLPSMLRVRRRRGRLVRRYFFIFVLLLGGGLMTSGLLELYYRYRDSSAQIGILQGEIASSAAMSIAQFILTIEEQMKATAVSSTVAQMGISPAYQFELEKLLSIAPAVVEVTATDDAGREQAFASRFRVSATDEHTDQTRSAGVLQAKQGVTFFGSVYFVNDFEPYMTIVVPIERFPGSVIGSLRAEINLRHIGEVIRDINVGKAGYAYIVTRSGDIIAHSNAGLGLERVNAGSLAQVQAAFQPSPVVPRPRSLLARDLAGANVLSSFAFLPTLDWAVLVEQPLRVAYGSLYQALLRTGSILLVGFGIAVIASIIVARRVLGPLEALRLGVERIGKGDLTYNLKIQTGDEIEILAEEFNRMVGQLRSAHDTLEQRVDQRTRELSVLYDVTAAATQSLDLKAVLHEVSHKIGKTFGFDATRIFLCDEATGHLEMQASFGSAEADFARRAIAPGAGIVSTVLQSGEPIVFANLDEDPRYEKLSSTQAAHRAGFCFAGFFPIKAKGKSLGIIFCGGRGPRVLTADEVRLITSIAEQIGGAVDNMNLFEEVRMANDRLKELDRMKSYFVSNVSHELRTPLTAIEALVDNMLDGITGGLNKKQTHYVTDIKTSADRLARLIEDLLDLSVIEAGKVELRPTYFSVATLVHEVIGTFSPMAGEKLLVLQSGSVAGHLVVWADRDKIVQVLTNLISNAVKFTPSQGRIYVAAETSGERFVEISVVDTGPGIEPQELKRIFEPFYQVRESGEKKSRGVGLGLAISKKLVEMHGGEIQAASLPGGGSRFSFTLPSEPREPDRVIALGGHVHGIDD